MQEDARGGPETGKDREMNIIARWKNDADTEFQSIELDLPAGTDRYRALRIIHEERRIRAGLVPVLHIDPLFGTSPEGFDPDRESLVRNVLDHDVVEIVFDGEPWLDYCKGGEIGARLERERQEFASGLYGSLYAD